MNKVFLNNRNNIKCHKLEIYDDATTTYKDIFNLFVTLNSAVGSNTTVITNNLALINTKLDIVEFNIYKQFIINTYLSLTTYNTFINSNNAILAAVQSSILNLGTDADLIREDIVTIIDAINDLNINYDAYKLTVYNKTESNAALLLKLNKSIFDDFIISNNVILSALQAADLARYTKTEINDLLALKLSTAAAADLYHTKEYLNAQIISIVSTFSNYSTSVTLDAALLLKLNKSIFDDFIVSNNIILSALQAADLARYTKTEINDLLALKLSTAAAADLYHTKEYLNAQIISIVSTFSNYSTSVTLDAALLLKLNKSIFDDFIVSNNIILSALQGADLARYTKTEINDLLLTKLSTAAATSAFSLYYTKVAMDDILTYIYTKTEITTLLNNIIANVNLKYSVADQAVYSDSINTILLSIQSDIINRYTKSLVYNKTETDVLIATVNSNFNIYYSKLQSDDKFLSKVNYNIDKFTSGINPKSSGVLGYFSTLWNYEYNNAAPYVADLYSVAPNLVINSTNWIMDKTSMQYLRLTSAANNDGYTWNISAAQIQTIKSVVLVCNFNVNVDSNIYFISDSNEATRKYVSGRSYQNEGITAIENIGTGVDIYYDGVASKNNSDGNSAPRYLLSGVPLKEFYDLDKNTVIIINNLNFGSGAVAPFKLFSSEFELFPSPVNFTFHEFGAYTEILTAAEIIYLTRFYKNKYGQVPT